MSQHGQGLGGRLEASREMVDMTRILVVFHGLYRDRLHELLERVRVPRYTELSDLTVRGRGGSATWPGRNAALITVADATQADQVFNDIQAFSRTVAATLSPAPDAREGVQVFAVPIEAAA